MRISLELWIKMDATYAKAKNQGVDVP